MKGALLCLILLIFMGVHGVRTQKKATSRYKGSPSKKSTKAPSKSPVAGDASCTLEDLNGVISQVPDFADGPAQTSFLGQSYSCEVAPGKLGNTYSFTAPQTATYQFDTIQGVDCTPETGITTVLQVLTSCHGDVLACAGSEYNYDLSPGTCSLARVALVAGQQVLIQVSAAEPTTTYDYHFVFRLSVSFAPPPTSSPVHSPTAVTKAPVPTRITKSPVRTPTRATKSPTLHHGPTRRPTKKPTTPLYWSVSETGDAIPLCSTPPDPNVDADNCLDAYEFPLRAGFYDVVGQGYLNDYCRYTYSYTPKVPTWYCLLSNTTQDVKIKYPLDYGCTEYVNRVDWGCLFYRSPITNSFNKTPRSYGVANSLFDPIYHPVTVVYPVYFGSQEWLNVITGVTPPTKTFPYDTADMVSGNEYFYRNIKDAAYAKTVKQYLNGASANISFGYNIFHPQVFGFSPSNQDPIADLCTMFKVNNITIDPNGYYPVYIQEQSVTADYVTFCAWHNAAYCDGVQFTYGLFFDYSDPTYEGCGAGLVSTFNNSVGLATWINVGTHELFEMTTDPLIADSQGNVNVTGWLNFEGNEVADLCAWSLSPVQVGDRVFDIQGLWSNSDYATQSGRFNYFDDEKGCSWGH